ncbi:MAG TPA: DUF302 domain-containing protein [Thermoanaerobaculia bacterium]|nr:DUF302 domain-containing protein [Thermoanaerobaculia bacterium]
MPARYEMSTTVTGSFAEEKGRVIDALKGQGFGVLTEIDVQKTMKEKLGVEMEPYVILGACNPQLAHRALEAERSIGLLLPCNVVLRQENGTVRVSILDPEKMFEVADASTQHDLSGLPEEARSKLAAALQSLEGR